MGYEVAEWEDVSYINLLSWSPATLSCVSESKAPVVIYGGGKAKIERERGHLISIKKSGNIFVVKIMVSTQNRKRKKNEPERDEIVLRNRRTRFSLGLPVTV